MKTIKKIFSALTKIGDGTGNFWGDGTGGFTMIELLVVIAVIGVLAVAVLSSLDPIEQINKGRDTRKRSNAAQLINAADRYYAISELYPWNDATYVTALTTGDTQPNIAFPDGTACADDGGFCVVGGTGAVEHEWLDALAETSEVKESFIAQLNDESVTNVLYLAKELNGDLYVCFEPASKQFQNEAIDGCINRSDILPTGACNNGPYTASSLWVDELICLP